MMMMLKGKKRVMKEKGLFTHYDVLKIVLSALPSCTHFPHPTRENLIIQIKTRFEQY